MTGEGEGAPGRRSGGRLWPAVGVLLAVGATVALILAEDMRLLRLGVLAALWAALIGTFLATRYRRKAVESDVAASKAQEIYELELEREVAARHEFELEVEAETRERVEDESRAELEALRAEVSSLRESLQSLLGGEVMWERIALTAQSTRMRSFGEELPLVTAGENQEQPRLSVGRSENPTEFIGRIVDADSGDAGAIARAIGTAGGGGNVADAFAGSKGSSRNSASKTAVAHNTAAAQNTAASRNTVSQNANGSSREDGSPRESGSPKDNGSSWDAGSSRAAASHGARSNGTAPKGASPAGGARGASNGPAHDGRASNGAVSNGEARNGAPSHGAPSHGAPATGKAGRGDSANGADQRHPVGRSEGAPQSTAWFAPPSGRDDTADDGGEFDENVDDESDTDRAPVPVSSAGRQAGPRKARGPQRRQEAGSPPPRQRPGGPQQTPDRRSQAGPAQASQAQAAPASQARSQHPQDGQSPGPRQERRPGNPSAGSEPRTQVVPRMSRGFDHGAASGGAGDGADSAGSDRPAGSAAGTGADQVGDVRPGEAGSPDEDPTRRVRAREAAAAKERFRPAQRAGAPQSQPQPPSGPQAQPYGPAARSAAGSEPGRGTPGPAEARSARQSAAPPEKNARSRDGSDQQVGSSVSATARQATQPPPASSDGPSPSRPDESGDMGQNRRDVDLTPTSETGARERSASQPGASVGQGMNKPGSQTAYAQIPETDSGGLRDKRAAAPKTAEPAPEAAPAEQPIVKGPLPPMSYPEQPAGAADSTEVSGEDSAVNPTLPPEVRDLARKPGGRRRRAEPEDDDPQAESSESGGRRRAPDPEDGEPTGSHSSGRSVSELLAAHGTGDTTPRRRRRAED